MIERPRRLRTTSAVRSLVAETTLLPSHLMQPLFVREGLTEPREIAGMPGVWQQTEQSILDAAKAASSAGVKSVMVFGIPAKRDATGSEACNPEGILTRTVRAIKRELGDELVVVADLCLDEFTDHGHCGVLTSAGTVDNDATLRLYEQMALTLADAGVDLLGTSGMMDGQVGALREALDAEGHIDVGILAYAAKYASSFYGPFRSAVESTLEGDRKTYQQDYRNARESVREISLDLEQGADIVMVKPATAYLDIVHLASQLSEKPVAAYLVSGELAMVEAAAAAGYIERLPAILELHYAVRRAGAQIVCSYWATEVANYLKKENQ